jgi:hypothetical protein
VSNLHSGDSSAVITEEYKQNTRTLYISPTQKATEFQSGIPKQILVSSDGFDINAVSQMKRILINLEATA